MSAASKLLIFGGVALAGFGMLYGLHYALFVEHQALDSMGNSLATAFTSAAARHLPDAHAAIAAYGATKYDYVRQVDVHSHWIGLAMLMIVLGVAMDHVAFGRRLRFWIALNLLVGSVVFPLGVLLQSESHGASYASATAIVGVILVTVALAAVAAGFARGSV
ncbi:MAG TPA: hypothetical protein VMU45_12640 [Candidatus Eisenbacteria bacterium]|jgi:hypothetical protein|nr:hypothetical protein [Candidatus Eisenbacteria bacterium]